MNPTIPQPLPIDHVVIAVPSLDAAIADYRALGFTVLPGGRHPGAARTTRWWCWPTAVTWS
jgi:hypothetical protein